MRRKIKPEEYLLPNGDLYLDNAAYRPMPEVVRQEWQRWFEEFQVNPSSSHRAGRQAGKEWDRKLEELASILGVQPRQCIAVSGSTEALNTYLKSFLFNGSERKTLVSAENEHPATLKTLKWMEDYGFETKLGLLNSSGSVPEDSLIELLSTEVACVVVSLVNGETGQIMDIKPIAARCKDLGIRLFLDATQTVGKFDLSDAVALADGFCFSTSKIGAGPGAGFLVLLDDFQLSPLLEGGGHQSGLRSGTLNLPAMLTAVTALKELMKLTPPSLEEINVFMKERFKTECELISAKVQFHNPWIALIQLPFEEAILHAEIPWLGISSGTACSSRAMKSPRSYNQLKHSGKYIFRSSF